MVTPQQQMRCLPAEFTLRPVSMGLGGVANYLIDGKPMEEGVKEIGKLLRQHMKVDVAEATGETLGYAAGSALSPAVPGLNKFMVSDDVSTLAQILAAGTTREDFLKEIASTALCSKELHPYFMAASAIGGATGVNVNAALDRSNYNPGLITGTSKWIRPAMEKFLTYRSLAEQMGCCR